MQFNNNMKLLYSQDLFSLANIFERETSNLFPIYLCHGYVLSKQAHEGPISVNFLCWLDQLLGCLICDGQRILSLFFNLI